MDITYFMVEVEAVETNIHIAAVTVEDASPIDEVGRKDPLP